MNEKNLIETPVSSEKLFEGRILHLYRDVVTLPNGVETTREYLKHGGAVCIVAITEDRKIVMEHQYRYPMGRVFCEIPAGKIDGPEEAPLDAAKRELEEETGITADHWTELGHFVSTPAYTSEDIVMYLASGLHKGERHLDEEEFLEVYEAPLDEVVEDILSGKIADGKTIAAVLKAVALMDRKRI